MVEVDRVLDGKKTRPRQEESIAKMERQDRVETGRRPCRRGEERGERTEGKIANRRWAGKDAVCRRWIEPRRDKDTKWKVRK